MAWTAPPTYTVGQILTAALMNNVSGDLSDLDSRALPQSQKVSASQSTTSGTFADLATVGPTVTLITGTIAIVAVSSSSTNTTNNNNVISVAVSGATTVTPIDDQGPYVVGNAAGQRVGVVTVFTGLTAGTNTFTMKYRVVGGTGTFLQRELIVWPGNKLS